MLGRLTSLILAIGLITSLLPVSAYSAQTTYSPLKTFYSFDLINSKTGKQLSVSELAKKITNANVIFIGELHGHQASHLLEAELQSALYDLRPSQVLSMEQFNRDHQQDIDQYLDGEVGEKTFMQQSEAWSNYSGSYRPLIEFAKRHFLPVIAANAPFQTVRCVGRQGKPYLQKLSSEEKEQIANQPFMSDSAYQQKFAQFQSMAKPHTQNQKGFEAQLLRDNTMAESILQAIKDNPGAQIIHTNGTFHSASHLGTVALLHKRAPKLNIVVISPIVTTSPDKPQLQKTDLKKGDYVYLIQSLPVDYVQASKRKKAFAKMFKEANAKACR
ncbi:ChaN family lipoprotein [Hydrogenovibrio kuenenii]|uniref:ChaN family lipoprotein n=1 Tax=Hydrogenovibrio kuenenii TaxID=63658 RepID=UPI0004663ACD|nr:ChaN family lipoprotein [Hydrogenovibrio kuenenii]